MQQTAPVTPERIFQTLTAFQHSAALKTAIELDIFTKIDEGNKTVEQLAEAVDSAERGVRILCDTLTVMGFLSKSGNEYQLSDDSAAFLNRNSKAFFGDAAFFLMSEKQMEGFHRLTEAVKNGGSVVGEENALAPDSPMWVKFARGMTGMMIPSAQQMVEHIGFETDCKIKVLDIAAGHGIFGIFVAQKYPNAEIYALDWANVLEVASENAEKFGVADRHHKIAGSAFDTDFGEGFDVVLLTNFLHHFDAQTCEKLLKKIHESLNEDGKVLTLEFVPNDDRITPPMEALFPLVMLAGTPAGDAYTFAELSEMFENAGFSQNELVSLEPMPQHLIVSQK